MILVQKQKYSKGKRLNGLLDTSGTAIAVALGLRVYTPFIKPKNRTLKIINWGLSNIPWLRPSNKVLNNPSAVLATSNKLLSFKLFKDNNIPTVPWTTSISEASSWLDNPDEKVVCRTLLSASSGRGIVIAKTKEELVPAKLYTLYIRKKWEFRVHVFNGVVIATQQKRRLTSEQLESRSIVDRCKYIRNLSNGYIFSSHLDDIEDLNSILEYYATNSIMVLGLDFGAVDLLLTSDLRVMVLEVNSAPGLSGSTLSKYVEAFKSN